MNEMTYAYLIKKLFNIHFFGGRKHGLENSLRLQKALHFPDRAYSTIHVAGTNGKGSVATKIAGAFRHAGYRVGLYTSPHISSFRERIRVNNEMISEKAIEELLPPLFEIGESEKIPATFFEWATFLAFLYFARERVDVAVLETGLGGRLDATNVVLPDLSIITSISQDHTDILGSDLESITFEKAGIIKEKRPILIGPHVPFDIIQRIALEKESPLIHVKKTSPLYEEENRMIASQALSYLSSSFKLSLEDREKGLKESQPCRFQVIPGSPKIILDVAHNPDGVQKLMAMLLHNFPGQFFCFLFGLSKNKDIEGCLKLFSTKGSHFHLVAAKNDRAASPLDLSHVLQTFGVPQTDISLHDSILKGVELARKEAMKRGEILVICGTFFIMSEVRQALGFHEVLT